MEAVVDSIKQIGKVNTVNSTAKEEQDARNEQDPKSSKFDL